jgi:beta-glucosidase
VLGDRIAAGARRATDGQDGGTGSPADADARTDTGSPADADALTDTGGPADARTDTGSPADADARTGTGSPADADARTDTGDPIDAIDARARELLDELTLHEKLHLLSGDAPPIGGLIGLVRHYNEEPYVAGAVPRLGIGGIRFSDGPRGVVMGHATAFPVPMARGASFDPELEQRIGDAIGIECRALGANLFAGVCVNLLRHPAWGRAQETYGEDSHVLGEMGAALVRGVECHVMACVKHFACNSIEDNRFRVDVRIDEDDLRDIYLPHFRRVVDEGVAAVMTAYNRVNGSYCGHHRHLITEILKGEWGFDGLVMSDFVLGVRSADAVNAGLDLEMPFRLRFRRLARLARSGWVPPGRIDDAALRILRQQLRFGRGNGRQDDRFREENAYGTDQVASVRHRTLAREAAERSIVLLRNRVLRRIDEAERMGDGAGPTDENPGGPANANGDAPAGGEWRRVLPLDPGSVESLAVFGQLAALPVTGDRGSSHVRAPSVATVLDGLQAVGERHVIDVRYQRGNDLSAAGFTASRADAAVVVAGYTHRDEGENVLGHVPRAHGRSGRGGDRKELTLRPEDERLIRTVAAANRRTIVVLIGGSAIVTEAWREQAGAILMAWYPGMEGGHAVARVLFGEVNPGGRLPCTWPRSAEQLPPFDPGATTVRYGPLHGYRLMQATERAPAFPFGFGLSYATFKHGRLTGRRTWDGTITVTVPVTNTGTCAGDEVVQLYLDEALGSDPRPLRALRGFRRVTVAPGATVNVTLVVPPDAADRAQASNGGVLVVHVGRSADPRDQRAIEV